MKTERTVESKEDIAFLSAIGEVFKQHPEAAKKYAISSLALEIELGIDFDRQHGISRVEDGRIITEFVDRDEPVQRSIPPEDLSRKGLEWPLPRLVVLLKSKL